MQYSVWHSFVLAYGGTRVSVAYTVLDFPVSCFTASNLLVCSQRLATLAVKSLLSTVTKSEWPNGMDSFKFDISHGSCIEWTLF